MMAKQKRFATEADLCAAFLAWVKRQSGAYCHGRQMQTWTAYPETAGWDILLVAADGTQIGVQAKQTFNMKVLAQTLPDNWAHWHDRGPDYRAILIPENDSTARDICGALGVEVFSARHRNYYDLNEGAWEFGPDLLMEGGEAWHWWSPKDREKLPEYVPDVVAGASGPVQLTPWKVSALRIVATLEVQGFVTRLDFKRHHIDPRRWTGPGGWLQSTGFAGRYIRGQGLDFDKQHPEVYAKVLEEIRAEFTAPMSTALATKSKRFTATDDAGAVGKGCDA